MRVLEVLGSVAIVLAVLWSRPVFAAPKNVKVVARSHLKHATVSEDGRRFAFIRRGDVAIASVTTGKVTHRLGIPRTYCGAGYCEGYGVTGYRFSPDGRQLAYGVDTGEPSTGLYVFDTKTRKTRKIADHEVWQMSWDGAGRLTYLSGTGTHGANVDVAAHREGRSKPLFRLPNRHNPKRGENGQHNVLGRRCLLTEVRDRDPKGGYLELEQTWLTELATGKAKQLAIPAKALNLTMAPTEDRVCYFDTQLRCLDLNTGRTQVIARDQACGWNDSDRAAWSNSGSKLAFIRCDPIGGVGVHDFGTGRTRFYAPGTRYRNHAFQGEDHLVLLHRWMSGYWQYLLESVGRVDLSTGERYALAIDRTSYPHALPVPGRTDRLIIARDREGTTDLAWMKTDRPIGPVKTTPKPRDGPWTEYQANGRPFLKLRFREGKRHGEASWYDYNGLRVTEGRYEHGEPRGVWTHWRPNGRIDKKQLFEKNLQRTLCWYRWEKKKC